METLIKYKMNFKQNERTKNLPDGVYSIRTINWLTKKLTLNGYVNELQFDDIKFYKVI